MSSDVGKDNIISIGDLDITFCIDNNCNNNYSNFGRVIGTKKINGQDVIENIYPYLSDELAIDSEPYIFNIKNTGSLKSFVDIKIKEDMNYELTEEYKNYKRLSDKYSNYIKVAISDCSNKIERENVEIKYYNELNDGILLEDEVFPSNYDKTYCLWTYLDRKTPNDVQDTYFVANLNFNAEYRPK